MKKSTHLFICFWIILFFHSGSSLSDEIKPIVISASFLELPANLMGQSVSVVTQEEIKKQHAIHVADVLRTLPGIDVVSLGTPGEDLDIRVRGSDRDEVLILLDSIPLNNLIESRATLLHSIPVTLIERIEIVRGASSSVYGSGAVGGVVNIITKKGSPDTEAFIKAQAGNLGHFKEDVGISSSIKKHEFAVGYSRWDQKGRFAHDRFKENAVIANYGVDLSSQAHLHFLVYYLNQNQDLAFSTANSFANFPTLDIFIIRDDDRHIKQDFLITQSDLTLTPTPWYTMKLAVSWFHQDILLKNSNQTETVSDPAATIESQVFDSSSHRPRIDLQNHFTLIDHNHLKSTVSVGTQWEWELLKYSDAPFPGDATAKVETNFPNQSLGQKGTRRNAAAFFQTHHVWKDRLAINLGARYDHNSTYGSATSPRIWVSYLVPAIETRLYGSYSQGFVAPTLNQYYLAIIGGTLTQRLDKETSRTYEIGIQKDFQTDLSLGLSYFYLDYDTHIDELQLIQNAHVNGLESTVSFRPFKQVQFEGSYTYTNARNEDQNRSLANRPKHRAVATVKASPIKDLDLYTSFQAKSSRLIPNVVSTQQLGDLSIQFIDSAGNRAGENLPATYHWQAAGVYRQKIKSRYLKRIDYSARIENLLNRSQQEKFGYALPKLTFLAGLELHY